MMVGRMIFFIREILVDKKFRWLNIWTELFDKCIIHAKKLNAIWVVTETAFDNIPTQKLCEKFWFIKWDNLEWKDWITYKLIFN